MAGLYSVSVLVVLFAASMQMAMRMAVDKVTQAQEVSRNATLLEARAEAVRNRQLAFILATEAKYTQLIFKGNWSTKSNGNFGLDTVHTEGGIDDPHGFLGSMPYDLGGRTNTVQYLQNAGPAHSRFIAATDMKFDMEWVIQIAKSYGAEFRKKGSEKNSGKAKFVRYPRIARKSRDVFDATFVANSKYFEFDVADSGRLDTESRRHFR
jgi:hypothetical protein